MPSTLYSTRFDREINIIEQNKSESHLIRSFLQSLISTTAPPYCQALSVAVLLFLLETTFLTTMQVIHK